MTTCSRPEPGIAWAATLALLVLSIGDVHGGAFTYATVSLDSRFDTKGAPETQTLSEEDSVLTVLDVQHRISLCPASSKFTCFCHPGFCFAVPRQLDDNVKTWSYDKQRFSVVDTPKNDIFLKPLPGVVLIESTLPDRRRILFYYSKQRGLQGYMLASAIGLAEQTVTLAWSIDGVGFGCLRCGAGN